MDGVLVEGCYLDLECELPGVIDGFGQNNLIVGEVVVGAAHEDALRDAEPDEGNQIYQFPLLVYLSPGRLAEIRQSTAFLLPGGFTR